MKSCTYCTQVLPIEEFTETLCTVAENDALAAGVLAEFVEALGEKGKNARNLEIK